MRINQLRQILEIEKCRSISQAARNLYISQPSLSIVLNDFEKEVGVQLFSRTNKGISPTPEGEQLLAIMHEIIADVDNLQSYAQTAQEMTGEVAVYIGPAYDFLVPEIILRFKAICPKVSLVFLDNTISMPNLVDHVYKRLCSFAVGCVLPRLDSIPAEDITIMPLAEVSCALLVNKAHPLCRKAPLLLADLYPEQVVVMDRASWDGLMEMGVLRLPFAYAPLLNYNRLAMFQLLQGNAAIALTALPLETETYEEAYPFLKILPFGSQLQQENWPTYLLHITKMTNRAGSLLLEELKKLLWEKGLL